MTARRSLSSVIASGRAAAPVPPKSSDPCRLGLPLTGHQVARLLDLERLRGTRPSWGRDRDGAFFVDVVDAEGEVTRWKGETLHLAIGAALRAARRTTT